MATFVPISYTYVPTAPRSKSATARRKPAPKQSSILDKLQHIKPSSTSLSTARPAAAARRADDIRGDKLGTRETNTVNDSDDDENDDNYDLPPIEQLLYTTLQKEGFAAEDQRSNNTAFGVRDTTAEERGVSHDDNGPTLGDNSGGSLDDPIVLLGDDDSSVSEAEVDDGGRAESAGADAGLFNSPENAADSTTLAPPPDVWHDIDDFPEAAQRLRLCQQGASASDSTHAPPSRLSSEPLHDSIGAVDLDARRARSEATTSCSARPQNPPPRSVVALLEHQLSHEGHLHTSRGIADERGLVGPARNADPVDEREQQQQQEDEDYDASSKSEHPPSLRGASVGKCRPLCENSAILGIEAIELPQADVDLLDWEADPMAPMQLKVWSRSSADRDTKILVDDQPEELQQEVKGVAAEPMAKRVGDTRLSGKADGSPRPAERQQLLPDREPSPATSNDEAGCDSHSGDGLNNTESDKDDEEPRPVKRKQPSSSQDWPMHKKPKPRLQQRSARQPKPGPKPRRRSPKSYTPLDQGSRTAAVSTPEGRLPSPALFTPHATDRDMSPDCCDLDRSSGTVQSTLTEVTFRPYSPPDLHSFTAIIRIGHDRPEFSLGYFARLIENVGCIGEVDVHTIKWLPEDMVQLIGLSRFASSRLPPSVRTKRTPPKTDHIHSGAASDRHRHSKAVDATISLGSELSSSDDDSDSSNSDPDSSSDDDGYSSEADQGRLSTSKHSRWSDLDEQRLLAYKKEDKSWEWIFRKFPGRTRPAIRTRWNMIRPKVA